MTAFPSALQDRFKPMRLLGQGGFGSVWLAEQTALKRPVALKALHPELVDTDEQIQRFRDEARLTASIRHPGVVTLLDHGVDDGVPWMAFEYVEGASLRGWVERGRTPWRRVLEVGLAIAQALEEARRGGIVHRDVKPDNILESVDGTLKLADFGIAKWGGNSTRTAAGVILGTPAYLSPNQVKGHLPAHQSDLYALGVTLFELITGTTPFVEQNPILMLERHISQTPPPVRQLVPEVPEEVELLLEQLLSKDREQRFDTANDLAVRITAILERHPVAAPAPLAGRGSATRLQRPSSRTTRVAPRGDAPPPPAPRSRRALVGVAVTLGVCLLAVSLRPTPKPRPPPGPSAAPVTVDAAALDALEARAIRLSASAENLAVSTSEAGELMGGAGAELIRERLERVGGLVSDYESLLRAALEQRGPVDDRLVAVHTAGVQVCGTVQQIFQQAHLASVMVQVPALDGTLVVRRLRSIHSVVSESTQQPDAYRRAMITDLTPLVSALAGPTHDAQRKPELPLRGREAAIAQLEATLAPPGQASLRTLGGIVKLHLAAAGTWRDLAGHLSPADRSHTRLLERLLYHLRRATAPLTACVAAAARERNPEVVDHALQPLFRGLCWLTVAIDHTDADLRAGLDGAAQLVNLHGDRWRKPPFPRVLRQGVECLNHAYGDVRLQTPHLRRLLELYSIVLKP